MNKHILIPIIASAIGVFTLGIPGVLYFALGYPVYFLIDLILRTNLIDSFYNSNMGDNAWPLVIMFSLIIPPLYIASYLYFRKQFQGKQLVIRSLAGWYILTVLTVAIITKLVI